jgi:hypothetical protein
MDDWRHSHCPCRRLRPGDRPPARRDPPQLPEGRPRRPTQPKSRRRSDVKVAPTGAREARAKPSFDSQRSRRLPAPRRDVSWDQTGKKPHLMTTASAVLQSRGVGEQGTRPKCCAEHSLPPIARCYGRPSLGAGFGEAGVLQTPPLALLNRVLRSFGPAGSGLILGSANVGPRPSRNPAPGSRQVKREKRFALSGA